MPCITYACRYSFSNRSTSWLEIIRTTADACYCRTICADKGSCSLGNNNAFNILVSCHFLFGYDTCHLTWSDIPVNTLVCNNQIFLQIFLFIFIALLDICRLILRLCCFRYISGNFSSTFYTKLGTWF